MRKDNKFILYSYFIFLSFLSIYTYSLVDPNLTLFNHNIWTLFRNFMIKLGYFHRELSSILFLLLIVLLFYFHKLILNLKKIDNLKLALIISVILFFSYPFLSHDFFNYLFDAKIFSFYHQNPYTHRALDFAGDSWLRFMHWTHRCYPYGPSFLALTVILSFFSFGKFILSYILFKFMWLFFYILSVSLLSKFNKRWGLVFATHPLILIEGLINLHNDFIAVSLGIIGVYLIFKVKKVWWGRLFFLLSAGVKYITIPIVILSRRIKKLNWISFLIILVLLLYLSIYKEIQPWYFLNVFIFLPFFKYWISRVNFFFLGLLLSYYPYIRFGGWDKTWKILFKHEIILAFVLVELVYLSYRRVYERNLKG